MVDQLSAAASSSFSSYYRTLLKSKKKKSSPERNLSRFILLLFQYLKRSRDARAGTGGKKNYKYEKNSIFNTISFDLSTPVVTRRHPSSGDKFLRFPALSGTSFAGPGANQQSFLYTRRILENGSVIDIDHGNNADTRRSSRNYSFFFSHTKNPAPGAIHKRYIFFFFPIFYFTID